MGGQVFNVECREPTSRRAKKGNLDVLMIAFGTRTPAEAEELKKELKEVEEWMNEWIPVTIDRDKTHGKVRGTKPSQSLSSPVPRATRR